MCSAASPPTPLYSHARTAPAAATPARPTPPPRRETRPHSGIVHEAPSGPGGRLPAAALPFVAFEGRASPLLAGRVVLLEKSASHESAKLSTLAMFRSIV